jgi:hypothetical protein
MTPGSSDEVKQELNVHIFSVSAQLVGVCLTVVGLFRVILRLKGVDSLADNILAADAGAFLAACFVSYASLRSRSLRRRRILERVADVSFGLALVLMTVVCTLIAWVLL